MTDRTLVCTSAAALCLATGAAAAQPYELRASVVASGGGSSEGGAYTLRATIGQPLAGPVAGPLFGDAFELRSGFWACSLAAPCIGDFNGDGTVNTLDVLAFLNAWAVGDPSADINGDGYINTLDVLAFLNAWAAGC